MPQSKELIEQLTTKNKELKGFDLLDPEKQRKLDNKFSLEFNFNSNHMEGNTLTYGETELLLFFDQTEGTHELREYEEMKAHDVALKMIKEEALDQERPLTEQFVRQLNERLLVRPFYKEAITPDGQQTRKQVIPGQYKTLPNSVRLQSGEIFDYTAPNEVPAQMHELINWFNTNSQKEHPLLLASILHYRFVRIHPFDDGNGRVARLLMNYVFLKNNYPIVVIKSSQKKEYLYALNRADVGDLETFTIFIGEQLLWSINLCLAAARGEDIDEEDDLDKELALLKSKLYSNQSKSMIGKNNDVIVEVFDKSIFPLSNHFFLHFDKLKDFFWEIIGIVTIKGFNSSREHFETDYNFKNLIELYKTKLSPFSDYQIEEVIISIFCEGVKRTNIDATISVIIPVEFNNYYVVIKDHNEKSIIEKPYHKNFSERDLKRIVKSYIRYIMNQIESITK